ncbi:MAG: Na+/H+ antiporter subunit C [Bryobacteraceae bacterium]|nr:Na+/H+ antiporter subunit C [Bryobacteraceae bacterium]
MNSLSAILVGVLFAAGLYMLLRRSIVKVIIGLALLSHSVNLLLFTAAGLRRQPPPILPEGGGVPAGPMVDPVPQALILTAIVISFGVLAFAVVLIHRAYGTVGTDDLDELDRTDT